MVFDQRSVWRRWSRRCFSFWVGWWAGVVAAGAIAPLAVAAVLMAVVAVAGAVVSSGALIEEVF